MFKQGSRFLVIDDSNIARELVRMALLQLDHKNVDVASDGQKGLDLIKKSVVDGQPYSLVFLDLNMPEIDGFKLLEEIRSSARTKELPVLIITTENAKASVVKAVMQGVVGYMVKPFGIEDIKNKVKEIYKTFVAQHE